MRKLIVATLIASCSTVTLAQGSLSAQIDAVNAAYEQQKSDRIAADEQRRTLQADKEAARKRAVDGVRRKEDARKAQLAAARKVKEGRDDGYEDQLRDLDIQERKLELQARKVHVGRENEFIDQKLKRNAAETDVVQSSADVNRNASEGVKSLLQDTGKAKLKESGRWFK